MAQHPPPPSEGFGTRAFPPVRNPVYAYDMSATFKQLPQPKNVLERPPLPPGVESRRTSYGDLPPVAGLTPIVPMAAQTPYNVWGLYPA